MNSTITFDHIIENHRFSGAILFSHGDVIIFTGSYGKSNDALGTSNTIDSKFRIGSISKTFTAVSVFNIQLYRCTRYEKVGEEPANPDQIFYRFYTKQLLNPPNTTFHYSNSNYVYV